jgi:pyridinium-3,5-bisthiocarboxylic acid mononucleotide nickel chelatase
LIRTAYFDCFAGVSGDMILGALLDAGVPLDQLQRELDLLNLEGYQLSAEKVDRRGLAATRAIVDVNENGATARTFADIREIIGRSRLPAADQATVVDIFARLAGAEAAVHGETPESVHFHDVGAIDAIVDIAGAVAGLRLLGVNEIYSSQLPLGSGSVSGAHGVLPVPAPATLALVSQYSIPIRPDPVEGSGELSTPTGVAILSALARFKRPPATVSAVGCGAGSRDAEQYANVLRLWIGEKEAGAAQGARTMLLIETNVDDMPAEQLAYAMDRLRAAGAADAWFVPIQMKKGRPGVMLSLLGREELEAELVRVVLRETSTFGVRVRRVWRHEADREVVSFESSLGSVLVKVRRIPGETPLVAPEFEACRAIADSRGMPLREVMDLVRKEAEAQFNAS